MSTARATAVRRRGGFPASFTMSLMLPGEDRLTTEEDPLP
jgi:hypothetical protein